MSSPEQQLAEYRMIRAKRHRISKFPEKYAGLLVFNPRIRAFYRISRFFARLPRFSYCSVNGGEDIPGRFKYRVFTNDGLLYIYDLREIGPFYKENPYLYDEIYPGISGEGHCNKIIREWSKVDPDTLTGQRFLQDREYQKSLF